MPVVMLFWYEKLSAFITYSLPSGLSVLRSNIKQVAERRRMDIERFLNSLFLMADEISHSDIVYTFFHPLLRDQQEANINATKVKGNYVCIIRNVVLAATKSAANNITDPTSPVPSCLAWMLCMNVLLCNTRKCVKKKLPYVSIKKPKEDCCYGTCQPYC